VIERFRTAAFAGLMLLASASGGQAAELRIEFAELAKIAQVLLADAKIRIHNAPGGMLGGLFNQGAQLSLSSLQIQKNLEFKPTRISLLNSIYELYLNEINSSEVRVTPQGGGLRLTVRFKIEGPAVIGDCVEGPCTFENVLPVIEWVNAGVAADLAPIRYNGGVSLQIRKVELLGQLTPRCKSDVGFFALNACRSIAVPQARKKIAELPAQVDLQVKKFNDPDSQAKIAEALKPRLTLGPIGEVQITNVVVDAKGIVASFRFSSLPQ